MLQLKKKSKTGCILCGDPPVVIGIFVPKKSKVESSKPRKTHPYGLCQKHFDSHEEPGQLDKIEKKIERHLKK